MIKDEALRNMSEATNEPLSRLRIGAEKKTRRGGPKTILVIVAVAILAAVGILLAMRKGDRDSVASKGSSGATATAAGAATTGMASTPAMPTKAGDPVLTVSGYV